MFAQIILDHRSQAPLELDAEFGFGASRGLFGVPFALNCLAERDERRGSSSFTTMDEDVASIRMKFDEFNHRDDPLPGERGAPDADVEVIQPDFTRLFTFSRRA